MNAKKYLVTGGSGFLGKAICSELKEEGHDVISISRGKYPELEEMGVCSVQADLALDLSEHSQLFDDVDTVFHVAAKVDMWGDYDSFYKVNVLGTQNVIAACKKSRVTKLVYTSSPSVVADGTDLEGIDESYPYPFIYTANYPKTKALAEQEVLAENQEELKTCALRPHLIWGPGDTNLVPTILKRAKAGRLMQVGSGENMVDNCFIEDCVQAHLLAAKALDTNPEARAKAYFISQGSPVNMWEWINDILAHNGLDPLKRKVSKGVAMFLASVLEGISRLRPGNPEPLLTRFLVSEMGTSHYFNINRARTLLGYEPRYTVAEGMAKTFGRSSK